MKKLLALLLVLVMVFTLAACGDKKNEESDKKDDEETTEASDEETGDGKETESEETDPEETEPEKTEPEKTEPEETEPEETEPVEVVDGEIYYFYSMTMDGETVTMEDLIEQAGEEYAAEFQMTIEITGEGTAIMCANGEESEMAFDDQYMWPVEDPEDTAECEIDGDTITISSDGMVMVFAK